MLDAPQLCFTRDTLVATASGSKPIGDIAAGEKVWAFDFERGVPVLADVQTRHDSHYDGAVVRIEAGSSWIETTAYHPFWVIDGRDLVERSNPREIDASEDEGKTLGGRWVNSHELRAGDTIYLQSGEVAKVTRLEQRYEPYLPVSNLTVRDYHTFFVGSASVLVHNTSWCEIRKTVENANPKLSQSEITSLAHVEARRIAHAQSNFADALNRASGLDALGKPRPHGVRQKALDPWDGTERTWHAHHLIRKNGGAESQRAQELLVEFGFDPYFGRECQVWAPNRKHLKEEMIDSSNKILTAVDAGGSFEQIRARIQSTLERIGNDFIDGKHIPG